MKLYFAVVFIFLALIAIAQPLPPRAAVPTASVTLAWDASPDASVTGYEIHFGVRSGIYTNHVTVGNTTTATITGLPMGSTYYFAATAYNATGDVSPFSNEAVYVPTGGGGGTNRPVLLIGVANWYIDWQSVVGVTNVLQWSTNMATWTDYISFVGTNGTTRVIVPNDSPHKDWRTTTR